MSHLDEKIDLIEETTELEELQFFQTQPHPCSYIDDEMASTVFLNPKQTINQALYSQLSDYGFRRSGTHIYKPLCENCDACIPMRIPADIFRPSRSQKRTWNRNQDLDVRKVYDIDNGEHYKLYERYINERHTDGDMYPASKRQFQNFLVIEWNCCVYYEFRFEGELIATSVADIMDNGISAVYTYYDPDKDKRSLGSYAILYLVEECKKHHLGSVYLGYWIKSSNKMNYKSSYRPLEILSANRWVQVN